MLPEGDNLSFAPQVLPGIAWGKKDAKWIDPESGGVEI